MVVGGIEGGEFFERDRELFITDNYLRGRVLVFDMDTLKFKHGWGAYGKPLKDIAVTQNFKYSPGIAPPKDFVAHLTLSVANDGFVYAADRGADRVQAFTKDGMFVELLDLFIEGFVKISTLDDDDYLFRDRPVCLWGRSSGRTFRLGDRLKVCVDRIDRFRKRIDFSVTEKVVSKPHL